jgi:hypothetical protein
MQAAVIEDGKVVNLIEIERLDLIPGLVCVDAGDGQIGDRWDGSAFVKPAPPVPQVYVPESIAMWQARQILIEDDLLDTINAILASIPDERARKLAQAKFEYSSTVRRDDALVKQVIPKLGKSEADIDQMFIRGAAL